MPSFSMVRRFGLCSPRASSRKAARSSLAFAGKQGALPPPRSSGSREIKFRLAPKAEFWIKIQHRIVGKQVVVRVFPIIRENPLHHPAQEALAAVTLLCHDSADLEPAARLSPPAQPHHIDRRAGHCLIPVEKGIGDVARRPVSLLIPCLQVKVKYRPCQRVIGPPPHIVLLKALAKGQLHAFTPDPF